MLGIVLRAIATHLVKKADLVRRGETCSENRVARIMQDAGLQGIPAVQRGRQSGQRPNGLSNHLARDFAVTEPNTKWVTDITYIRTGGGWLWRWCSISPPAG